MKTIFSKTAVLFLILLPCSSKVMLAQNGPDPGRAALFATYAKKAKKALRAQDALLAANLTEHKYLKEEVIKTTDLQRQFNDYLNSFEDILTTAADIYGIYMEVNEAMKNLKVVKGMVVRQPANVLAVALSRSKNNIYHDLIENGLKVAGDIEQLFPLNNDPDKRTKLTQYERIKITDNIRLNLRALNIKLRTLSRLVHYTTIMDSWYDIKGTGKEYRPRKMKAITSDCLKSWSRKAKGVKY